LNPPKTPKKTTFTVIPRSDRSVSVSVSVPVLPDALTPCRFRKGKYEDLYKSAKWFRMAAEQGYAAAEYNLGCLYRDGGGVRQSDTAAARWYRSASNQGHPKAQYVWHRGAPACLPPVREFKHPYRSLKSPPPLEWRAVAVCRCPPHKLLAMSVPPSPTSLSLSRALLLLNK